MTGESIMKGMSSSIKADLARKLEKAHKLDNDYFTSYLNQACGGILWSILKPEAPTRITRSLLSRFRSVQSRLVKDYSNNIPINYHVLSSDIPDIFSLGGDLEYFCSCARNDDREGLKKYARDSVNFVYSMATNYHLPITTIALVKGAAMGGGFEAALSANYLIAEEQAIFSFPETRFGLFPGMGAYTLLRQRVPAHIAEEIIYSSHEYTAKELHDMNVVDQLCKTGQGYKTTLQFIHERQHKHQGIHAMRQMVQQYSKIDKQELYAIVDHWVESVMALDDKQLRLIDVLSQTSLSSNSRVA